MRGQFIIGTEGLKDKMIFGKPLSGEESGRSLIASFRVDPHQSGSDWEPPQAGQDHRGRPYSSAI